MATTMTLTDPDKAAQAATTPKPGTPDGKLRSARTSIDLNDQPLPDSKPENHDEISSETHSEDGEEYLQGLPLTFVVIALCLAVFLVALDQTIIATAIPRITGMDSCDFVQHTRLGY